jgi:hypothetical protein
MIFTIHKKSCPATCHWGTWGEKRYSSYSNLTSALDGGWWSASRPGRALPPGKELPVPIVQEAEWAPQPVWMQRLEEKFSAPVRDRTPIVQPVVRYYTDWATAAPFTIHTLIWTQYLYNNWYRYCTSIQQFRTVKQLKNQSMKELQV